MKFIHTGDIHLGAKPDEGHPWSEQREKEIWDSFKGLIEIIKQEGCDLLLIVGDFFHRQPLVRELKEVNYLFSTIPNTQVVIVAGNHDYIKGNSGYQKFAWSDNVVGMWDEDWQEQYFPKLDTWVYGMSYHNREIPQTRGGQVRHNGKAGRHILMLHGGDDSHIPFNKVELLKSDFDYIALGHIHRPQVLEANKMAFCGALEPLDRNDIGEHGYILGEVNERGIRTEFVPAAVRSYVPLDIEVDSDMTQFELETKISGQIANSGNNNIYTINLNGFRNGEIRFSARNIMELGNVVKVIDETKPNYDIEKLYHRHKGSLIGDYIEHFADKQSDVEKKAFYYGLNALLEAKTE
jgi:DNA repair exonuclease